MIPTDKTKPICAALTADFESWFKYQDDKFDVGASSIDKNSFTPGPDGSLVGKVEYWVNCGSRYPDSFNRAIASFAEQIGADIKIDVVDPENRSMVYAATITIPEKALPDLDSKLARLRSEPVRDAIAESLDAPKYKVHEVQAASAQGRLEALTGGLVR